MIKWNGLCSISSQDLAQRGWVRKGGRSFLKVFVKCVRIGECHQQPAIRSCFVFPTNDQVGLHLSGWRWRETQGLGRSRGGSVFFRRAGSISSAYLRGFSQESTALGMGSVDGLLKLLKIYSKLFVCFHIMEKCPKLSPSFQRL